MSNTRLKIKMPSGVVRYISGIDDTCLLLTDDPKCALTANPLSIDAAQRTLEGIRNRRNLPEMAKIIVFGGE
jgi:hypothetical protein